MTVLGLRILIVERPWLSLKETGMSFKDMLLNSSVAALAERKLGLCRSSERLAYLA